MIEAARIAARDDDPLGPELERDVERQLEIGRVLLLRMGTDARPGCLDLDQPRGRHRVEVAHGDRNLEPDGERGVDAAVCGNHLRIGRKVGERAGIGSRGDHDDGALALHAFLRWHYPGQVRGSAAR